MNVTFLTLYNELCQHLKDLCNSENNIFQTANTCYKIMHPVKDLLKYKVGGWGGRRGGKKNKVQGRLMDFNVTKYDKLTDTVSKSTLKVTF